MKLHTGNSSFQPFSGSGQRRSLGDKLLLQTVGLGWLQIIPAQYPGNPTESLQSWKPADSFEGAPSER